MKEKLKWYGFRGKKTENEKRFSRLKKAYGAKNVTQVLLALLDEADKKIFANSLTNDTAN